MEHELEWIQEDEDAVWSVRNDRSPFPSKLRQEPLIKQMREFLGPQPDCPEDGKAKNGGSKEYKEWCYWPCFCRASVQISWRIWLMTCRCADFCEAVQGWGRGRELSKKQCGKASKLILHACGRSMHNCYSIWSYHFIKIRVLSCGDLFIARTVHFIELVDHSYRLCIFWVPKPSEWDYAIASCIVM